METPVGNAGNYRKPDKILIYLVFPIGSAAAGNRRKLSETGCGAFRCVHTPIDGALAEIAGTAEIVRRGAGALAQAIIQRCSISAHRLVVIGEACEPCPAWRQTAFSGRYGDRKVDLLTEFVTPQGYASEAC